MENCSNARRDPRISGALISAMYKGDSILYLRSSVDFYGERWDNEPERTNPNSTDSTSYEQMHQSGCRTLEYRTDTKNN